MNPEIALLLRIIDEAYEKKAWHGPNLRGSLRGVTAQEAVWRPGKGRHNIQEIVVHAAYWKYAVRRRLRGEKRGSFPYKGSNWFARPGLGKSPHLTEDLKLLGEEHRLLREAITAIPISELHATTGRSKVSNLTLICGIASHDIYHAAQIQLLKRLQSS